MSITSGTSAGLGPLTSGPYVSNNTIGQRTLSAQDYRPKTKKIGFEVQEAENGYVLRYAYNEGEYTRTKVAKDMEEVRDLVTSILVERKLGI